MQNLNIYVRNCNITMLLKCYQLIKFGTTFRLLNTNQNSKAVKASINFRFFDDLYLVVTL